MAMVLRPDVSNGGSNSSNSASSGYSNPNGLPGWLAWVEGAIQDSANSHPSTGIPGSGSGMDNIAGDVHDVITGNYQGNANGTNPFAAPTEESYGDNSNGNQYDETGYSQALWAFERQKELLAEQRAYNSAEAEKAREWQERMSNTAYQRATQDLEAAGLNKWLAVSGGNGASASTPSGASASSSSGDSSVPNPAIYKSIIQFLESVTKSAFSLLDFF